MGVYSYIHVYIYLYIYIYMSVGVLLIVSIRKGSKCTKIEHVTSGMMEDNTVRIR